MIRRPPRSTLFPTRRSSDLCAKLHHMIGLIIIQRDKVPGRVYADPVDGRCRIQYTPSSDDLSNNRSEEHTSELQSRRDLVCRLLLEKKNKNQRDDPADPGGD